MKNFLFCLVVLLGTSVLIAQQNVKSKASYEGTISSVEYVTSISSRLNDLVPPDNTVREAKDKRSIANLLAATPDPQTEDDYFVRNKHEKEQSVRMAPASLVFDTYTSNSQPTDPSLAVGPNHVMVVFNTGFAIYDKSGNELLAPTAPNPAIFPSGGCCDLTASYDNAADRWVLTFLNGGGAGAQVAISDGPNPVTAGWFVYNISQINDYQKLSVWSDGYYITDNTSSTNKVWALERDAMLTGDTNAQILGFNLPGIVTSGFFSPQVLNVTDSNLPATGGATVVYLQDNAWAGVSSDHIKVWTIDVDWVNSGNSTVSAAQQIPVTSFIGVFDGGSFTNLTQPGGGTNIDALQATIMNQAQFRKFATHNSAVFNFVVDTDASGGELAGVRWMEFRQSGDNQPWSLYQEGTYTAPDGRHAWNASLAMDNQGNIGMGYTSMSGPGTPSTVRVSSYFTGRLNSDPLGTMTATEELIANGNQNIPGTRYGDYAKIDVDPSNDSTFWYITEYMNSGRKGVVGTFDIQPAGPPDTEAPTDPSNLTATNVTSNSATLNWTAATDNIGVVQYNISIDGTQVGTSATTTFDVTGLSPTTTYSASVTAQDAAGNISGSVSTTFTTLEGQVTYCASASTNVNDEFISRVQLNTIDNASGAQFYSDFTAISTNLTEGQNYTITVTPTWTGTVFNEGYAVWIDYNNNGDFDDSGELVWSKAPSQDTPNSGSFTVPAGTSLTSTRMRVSMKYNAIPTSCESFTWGEVEDYTVNLQAGGGPDTQPPSNPTNLTASNVTDTTADLSWNAATDNVAVTGYEIFQDGVSVSTTATTSATITGLTAATSYDFSVRAFDAAGNNSGMSNTVTITTTDGGSAGVIAGYFFETGLEGWSDPGSDCARVFTTTRSFEGSYSVRLRDNSSTSNTVSPVLDLSGNGEITFEFHVYINSFESGEDFFVEFFNGSSYQVIGQYVVGVDYSNNQFFTDTITLDAANYSFNANNRFRLRCDASGNGDRAYFDQIIISGDNVRVPFVKDPVITPGDVLRDFTRTSVDNIKLYPNPAKSMLNIEILEGSYDEIMIFSTAGNLVREVENGTGMLRIDISQFATGPYFVRFVSNGKAVTKRFIKK